MSNPIPSQLALSTIVNGTLADGSVVQANDAAIQTAVNALIVALSGGTNGQFLKATDGSDVVWEAAASLVTALTQTFAGPVITKGTGDTTTSASIAAGVLPVTTNCVRVTGSDASTVTKITGNVGAQWLYLFNATGSTITFGTGGGTGGLREGFTLGNGAGAFFVYDTIGLLWTPLAIGLASADRFQSQIQSFAGGVQSTNPSQGVGYATGAGGSVTQATNRSTTVTLNTATGQISTSGVSLASGTSAVFTVNNSVVASSDSIVLNCLNPPGRYYVSAVRNGSFDITYVNEGAGADITVHVFNFAVIKGVVS